MSKRMISIFWVINPIILGIYFVNYFFNQGSVNMLEEVSTLLYKSALPFVNILLAIIVTVFFLYKMNNQKKIQFKFDKSFKYLFYLLILYITLSSTQRIVDTDFLNYFATVVLFAITSSVGYKENTSVEM